MTIELFIFALALLFAVGFAWAFKQLPQERWQMIAAVPISKRAGGDWHGLNLTFYGFFQATANVFSVVIVFILLGAINVPAHYIFTLIVVLLAICWPAAGLIARMVEKKSYTFTVGGAVFVGTLVLPWLIQLLNATMSEWLGGQLPILPAYAAIAIAYAFGEGIGRLACISFGCCYGKSIEQLSPRLRRILATSSITFEGATRKAIYEGRLEGTRIVPIQAITAIILTSLALMGAYLFLKSYYVTALLFVMTTTQVWRFLSEWFRADVRGGAEKITAYQVMALLLVVYIIGVAMFAPTIAQTPTNIATGLWSLWNPTAMLFCQSLWAAIFLHTGRSKVTGATLSFFVHKDRI